MKFVMLAALVAALLVPAAFGATKATTLNGVDGPGFTITLTKGSTKVSKLKPGVYVFKIADKSNQHNFHLTGPGVSKTTGVGFVGKTTWKLKLKKGTYKFVCDPHATFMKGFFKVG